jgi:MFS family permease
VCTALFLRGIDYGVVMPSMWRYQQTFDENITELFFGVTIASFSAAGMIFSPLFGYVRSTGFYLRHILSVTEFLRMWLDRRPMKEVMIVLSLISVLGSAMYGLSLNNWMILGARIMCGIGSIQWTGKIQ